MKNREAAEKLALEMATNKKYAVKPGKLGNMGASKVLDLQKLNDKVEKKLEKERKRAEKAEKKIRKRDGESEWQSDAKVEHTPRFSVKTIDSTRGFVIPPYLEDVFAMQE